MSKPLQKNREFRSAVFGMLLGDATVYKDGHNKEYSFSFEHSIKQEKYCRLKAEIINKFIKTSIYIRERKNPWIKYHHINNKYFKSICVKSRAHPFFTKLRNLFYPCGKKMVSRRILNEITPIGLALWYMDDGSLNLQRKKAIYDKDGKNISPIHSRCLKISTESFSYNEHEILQKYFIEKWGIEFKIKLHDKNNEKFCLITNATGANTFINIISPYIIPDMYYKIDMKYSYDYYVQRFTKPKVDSDLYGNIQSCAEMTQPVLNKSE